MKQYLNLLKAIKETGDYKEPARENMPGTYSLFGYQFRHKLEDGFPLLTTKKLYWKGVVIELLWFLKGDTNIKFLDNYGVRKMWHQDAYNYYVKIASRNDAEAQNYIMNENEDGSFRMFTFEEFCQIIKEYHEDDLPYYEFKEGTYTLGDCGAQYGKLWRDWTHYKKIGIAQDEMMEFVLEEESVDQIKDLIHGLKTNPTGRRHIITAWNPATLNDMALNACHCMAQWNCRKLSDSERADFVIDNFLGKENAFAIQNPIDWESIEKQFGPIPKYYLDCQMYQRSADSVLGVPYNIASYALLTHLISKVCNMIPGDFIHTFGDVHIYEDHLESVKEQLKREPSVLPTLNINTEFWLTETGECGVGNLSIDGFLKSLENDNFLKCLLEEDIQLVNYNPQESIKANLSTGMKK